MNKFFSLLLILIFCVSCSRDTTKVSVINEKSLNSQVLGSIYRGHGIIRVG